MARVRTARHSTRGASRTLAPRVARQWRDLGALALVAALLVWCLDRITSVDERTVWGGDLYSWVRRLDATERNVRDSAIVAVGDLARRAWDDLSAVGPSESTRWRSPTVRDVTASVVALSSHLADPDSLLRQHAASALLELTERAETGPLGVSTHPALTEPLRDAVRERATELLLWHVSGTSPRPPADAALEVLAAVGAPPISIPVLIELVRADDSPGARALALAVLARAAGSSALPLTEAHSLFRAAAGDASPEVRGAAREALDELELRVGAR